MRPSDPSLLALFWRAVWRTTRAGVLYSAGFSALVIAVLFIMNPSPNNLGGFAGILPGSLFGAALGLVSGLTLGAVLAVAWRRGTPEPHEARSSGLLAWQLVVGAAALLTVALSWRGVSSIISTLSALLTVAAFMAIPAALLFYWLVSEAESLARWRRWRQGRAADEAARTFPLPEP